MITQNEVKVNTYLPDDNRCLIIQNLDSGKGKKPTPEQLMKVFDLNQDFVIYDGNQEIRDYLDIIVSGGDGTISNAVNLCDENSHRLYYAPTGTINDFGKIRKQNSTPIIGKANDKRFCYVLASGTFTSIGYTAKRNVKVHLGRIAYYLEALKAFKIQKIDAIINTEKNRYSGSYTLIMCLRSPRCFGFKFNRLYDPSKKELYLLLVEAPKNRLSLFLKFFRCFFVGFKKPYDKNGITFIPISFADIDFENEISFCLDGDEEICASPLHLSATAFNGTIKTKRRVKY